MRQRPRAYLSRGPFGINAEASVPMQRSSKDTGLSCAPCPRATRSACPGHLPEASLNPGLCAEDDEAAVPTGSGGSVAVSRPKSGQTKSFMPGGVCSRLRGSPACRTWAVLTSGVRQPQSPRCRAAHGAAGQCLQTVQEPCCPAGGLARARAMLGHRRPGATNRERLLHLSMGPSRRLAAGLQLPGGILQGQQGGLLGADMRPSAALLIPTGSRAQVQPGRT